MFKAVLHLIRHSISFILAFYIPAIAFAGYTGLKSYAGRTITIFGQFPNDSGKKFTMKVFPYYCKAMDRVGGKTLTQVSNAGKFRFVLFSTRQPLYISLNILQPINAKENLLWLVEPGDSIEIGVEKGKFYFTGHGSKKFDCQQQILQLHYEKYSPSESGYFFSLSAEKRLRFYVRRMDSIGRARRVILDRFKSSLPRNTFNQMKVDIKGETLFKILESIDNTLSYEIDTNLRDLYFKYYRDSIISFSDTLSRSFWAGSKTFSEFLFVKMRDDLLTRAYYRKDPVSVSIAEELKYIDSAYSGLLKDKLITSCFYNNYHNSAQNDSCLLESINKASTPFFKNVLRRIASTQTSGSRVLDFTLPDRNNYLVHLSDFRGRVAVVDFWFTGCIHCIDYARQLKKLKKYFQNNRSLIFITVSIDADKQTWIKSLAAGNYTDDQAINLYTNGLGYNHPLIRFYDFNGYPSTIIVDKAGKLVTKSPPYGDDEKSYSEYVKILESALKKAG